MSKYSEIVAMLEYFDRKKEEQPKQRGHRRYRNGKESDPINHILQMKRMVDEYNKIMADIEKVNKKEDKKEEPKKTWWEKQSFIQKIAVLTLTVPPCMMGMIILCLAFAKTVKLFF